jgi:hypothetical protein
MISGAIGLAVSALALEREIATIGRVSRPLNRNGAFGLA